MAVDTGPTSAPGTVDGARPDGDAATAGRAPSEAGPATPGAKRLAPKSPGAALEPERGAEPKRPPRGAWHTSIDVGKVIQHHLTIPEGLTSEQIVARLMETNTLAGKINEIPKEGTLLPETYKFTRGTTREQLIQRMQQAQKKVLQDIWDRRSSD